MMRVLVTGGSGFIGTNLIQALYQRGDNVSNVDSAPPQVESHRSFWQRIDVRDARTVADAVRNFQPTHIVHLAALATFDATWADLRACNVDGSIHVLDAALAHAPNCRIIVTSTQYVNGPGAPFDEDTKFNVVNDYGQSKADTEIATRADKYAALDWIIVRPTNIWGAFHPRFPSEIWKYIRWGVYMHPGRAPIVRAYGYIGNVVRQIDILLKAPVERVRHQVFYLTDPPIDSYELLNQFSLTLRGRSLPRMPYSLLRVLAWIGDIIKGLGLKAPFRSDRLHRMVCGHSARFEKLWAEFGYEPINLSDAVVETKNWLIEKYPQHYR